MLVTTATPHIRLAASLAVLSGLQNSGRRVFQATEITRVHRDRLLRNGFLKEVMKGWLISSSPDVQDGESTPWHASFWEFCSCYCLQRFGQDWCVSPEHSLLYHGGRTAIPPQVVIHSPKGANHNLQLLFGTSLFDLRQPKMPPASELAITDGLRFFTPEAALVRVAESFIAHHPLEVRKAIRSIRDGGNLTRLLPDGGHSVVAGRLAGAFRECGNPEAADQILATMKAAGYDVRETNPFPQKPALRARADPVATGA